MKSELSKIIEEGTGGRVEVFEFLETLEQMVLLKLHKYLFWADKKIHSVFFIENKEDISEDLLIDFRSEEDKERFKKST